MSLTALAISHIKPGKSRIESPDGEVGGLYLITQPSGEQSWAWRYQSGGRSRKFTIGKYPEIGIKDARNIARQAHLDAARGVDPGAEKKAARVAARTPVDRDLIEKVTAEFIKRHVPHLAESTQHEVKRILAHDILPAFRGRKLSLITKHDIHVLLDRIADRGAPVMANRALTWFKLMCNWAIGRGIIGANPCAGISRPEPETPRERVLNDAELADLWTASYGLTNPFGQFTRILILTGQRREEVAAAEWHELDFAKRIWTLPGRRAKNKIEHQIPLGEVACEVLNAVPRLGDFVFSLRASNSIQGFQRIKARLDELLPPEMQPWVMHDLRRTFASGLARLGVNMPVVEKLLNHVSGSFRGIVSVYQRHDFAEEKRHAMNRWEQHIADIVDEPDDNVVRLRS